MQLDMRNQTSSLNKVTTAYPVYFVDPQFFVAKNFQHSSDLFLSPSEFTDNYDQLGLFEAENDPTSFLVPDDFTETTTFFNEQ